MGFFSDTARAAAAGQTIRLTHLVFFDFLSAPLRVHPGFGPLRAGGYVWQGLGGLGAITGLEVAMAGNAPETVLTLSGVDPANVALALANTAEVKGRDVTIYVQFFGEDSSLLDAPYAVALLTMDILKVKANGAAARTIELSAESIWAQRSTAPWGYLSDRSQQARYPGDNGLDQVPSMQDKIVDWPVYGS